MAEPRIATGKMKGFIASGAMRVAGVGAAYCLAALASLMLARTTGNLAAVWLASPILLTVLLHSPRATWPAYISVCIVSGTIADVITGATIQGAVLLALADMVGVLLAAWMLTRPPNPVTRLSSFSEVMRFLLFGVVIGPGASAPIRCIVISGGEWSIFSSTALQCYSSIALGMLVVAPLLLSWNSRLINRDLSRPGRFLEGFVLFLSTCVSVNLIFGFSELPLLILSSPLLVWAAIRFRIAGLAVVVLVMASGAIAYGLVDFGMPGGGPAESDAFRMLQFTQIYLSLLAIPMYLLAAMLNDHDRTRRNLTESEQRFRNLAELAGDWFWETDEQHRFCDFSGRFFQTTSFTAIELLGRTRWEIAGGDSDGPVWREHIADLNARRPFQNFRYAISTADGHTRHFVASGRPKFDRKGRFRGYAGAGQEITDAVIRDAELRASEQRFRNYAAASSDYFWQMNNQLQFTWFSERFTEVTGVKVESLLGKSRQETEIPGVDPDGWRKHLDDLRNRRAFRDFVHPRTRSDGHTVWLSISGRPVFDDDGRFQGYCGTGSDVTALVEGEKALRQNEAKLRAAQRIAGLGSFERDLRTGSITWSDEAFRIWGHDPARGVPSFEAIAEQVRPDGRENFLKLEEITRKHGGTYEQPFEIVRADNGEHRIVLVQVTLQSNRNGGSETIAGTTHDITDRMHTEEALRQAQKMEAVGQLTGGLAHDFNNLLTVITGNLRLIHRRIGDEPRLSRQIRAAEQAAIRGADLTRRLLAFSKRQVLDTEVVDPRDLVAGMDDLLGRSLGESMTVRVQINDPVLPVRVDTGQLENAILNLAINARDAMQGNGTLTISIDNASPGDVNEGKYVRISVRDSGAGMTREVRERALEPFFTTKEVNKGSGLGLSMVYGFVKQSGGSLEIDSSPGLGTAVHVYLPGAEGEAPAPSDRPETPVTVFPDRPTGHTVLVVEDDEAVRETAVMALEELGYRVVEAADGPSALSLLENRHDIDLLLTDVIMPGGINGVELAKLATRIRPRLRVLYTTGYSQNAFAGADIAPESEILNKPYLADELARKLRSVFLTQSVA